MQSIARRRISYCMGEKHCYGNVVGSNDPQGVTEYNQVQKRPNMLALPFILAVAIFGAANVTPSTPVKPEPGVRIENIGGQTIEKGCDPAGWCWKACTIPSNWRVAYVPSVQKVDLHHRDIFGFADKDYRLIIMPKKLQKRAVQQGWTLKTLFDHEAAHACWQEHETHNEVVRTASKKR